MLVDSLSHEIIAKLKTKSSTLYTDRCLYLNNYSQLTVLHLLQTLCKLLREYICHISTLDEEKKFDT